MPTPATAQHPLSAFAEVPYPPPAALAEMVPPHPDRADVVWIDGEWIFRGGSFKWRRGGWVVPPPSGRFAPWRAWYRRDGRLMYAQGTWYDVRGEPLAFVMPLVPAYTPPNRLTPEAETGR